jgi:hypothetical protein
VPTAQAQNIIQAQALKDAIDDGPLHPAAAAKTAKPCCRPTQLPIRCNHDASGGLPAPAPRNRVRTPSVVTQQLQQRQRPAERGRFHHRSANGREQTYR